jgi:hypothetical protein
MACPIHAPQVRQLRANVQGKTVQGEVLYSVSGARHHGYQLHCSQTMQALVLVLFIVPFTLSFFLNGCFEADMDNRLPPPSSCLHAACSPLTISRRPPDTITKAALWAVSDACSSAQHDAFAETTRRHHRHSRRRHSVSASLSHPPRCQPVLSPSCPPPPPHCLFSPLSYSNGQPVNSDCSAAGSSPNCVHSRVHIACFNQTYPGERPLSEIPTYVGPPLPSAASPSSSILILNPCRAGPVLRPVRPPHLAPHPYPNGISLTFYRFDSSLSMIGLAE